MFTFDIIYVNCCIYFIRILFWFFTNAANEICSLVGPLKIVIEFYILFKNKKEYNNEKVRNTLHGIRRKTLETKSQRNVIFPPALAHTLPCFKCHPLISIVHNYLELIHNVMIFCWSYEWYSYSNGNKSTWQHPLIIMT